KGLVQASLLFLSRKHFSPLFPPGFQHFSSVFRAHPLPKPVHFFPLPLFRLERTLHDPTSSSLFQHVPHLRHFIRCMPVVSRKSLACADDGAFFSPRHAAPSSAHFVDLSTWG